jgi:hypothetical protein
MTARGARFRAEHRGKVQFTSQEGALRSLAKYRDKPDAPDMHSYRCTFCDYWHLGHVQDPGLGPRHKPYQRARAYSWTT